MGWVCGPPVGEPPHVVVQRVKHLAGHRAPIVGGPALDDRVDPGDDRPRVGAAQCAHFRGEPVPNSLDRILARFDQQLGGVSPPPISADVEPEEIETFFEVNDVRLVLGEDQTTRCQPCRQPCLDLFGLLPGMTADGESDAADNHRPLTTQQLEIPKSQNP